jgi:hypothetical protein
MLGADVAEDRCMHVEWCVHAADISKNLVIHACTPTNHGDPIDISDHRKTHVLYGVLRKNELKLIDLFVARNTGLTWAPRIPRRGMQEGIGAIQRRKNHMERCI